MANVRRGLAKWGRKLARWVGYALAGILALIVVLLLCINLKPLREFIRARANAAVATSFAGTLTIQRIGYITPYSLGGVDAEVSDAQGRRVLSSRGLSATCHWPGIVWDLIRKRPLTITLAPVRSDDIEVILIDDGQGSPTLASAFAPRKPSEEKPSEGPPTTISIPDLKARHMWVHGGLASLPSIDTELSELGLGLRSRGSELDARLDGVRVWARNLPAQVNPRGKFVGKVSMHGEPKSTINAFADFDGTLSGAPAKLHAEMQDKRVLARLDAPAIPPSALAAQVPSLALRSPTRFGLKAQGNLPRIDFEGLLQNDAIDAALSGHVTLEDTLTAAAELHAKEIDASGFVATAPKTKLAVDASFAAEVPKAAPVTARYDVKIPVGTVRGLITPEVAVAGQLTQTKEQGLLLVGTLDTNERGIKVQANYSYAQTPDNQQTVVGHVLAELTDSPRLRQLSGLQTSGTIKADTALDLTSQRFQSARASVMLSPIVHGTDRVGSLTALVGAAGSLSAPTLDVTANATQANVSGQKFKKLDVAARGNLERLAVRGTAVRDEDQRIDFETLLSSGKATELLSSSVSLRPREGAPVNLRAKRIAMAGEQLRFDGVQLDGAGTLAATGSYGGGRADVEFDIQDLDVARLTRLARVDTPIKRSLVTAKGHVKGPIRRLQGKLEAHVRNIEAEHVRGGTVDVDLNIENQVASGTVAANLGDSRVAAKLEDIVIPAPGAKLSPAALTGKLVVNGSLELARVANVLRSAGAPVQSATGHLDLELNAERRAGGPMLPRADLKVKTKALKLVQMRPKKEGFEDAGDAKSAKPLALDGVDLDMAVSLDPQQNRAKVLGSLFDKKGPMFEIDAESQLPNEGVPLEQALAQTNMKMSARVPARELDELPRTLRPPSLHGVFQAAIEAEGNLRQPKLMATAGVRGFRTREGGRRSVSGELMFRYDKTRGELRGSASTTRQPNAMLVATKWDGDLIGKLMNEHSPLDLDAEVKLDKFPIALVPMVSDRSVKGPVSCDVKLEDLGKNAKLTGTIDGSGLRMGSVQLSKLDVTFNTEDKRLVAKVDAREQDGTLQVDVSTPVAWGAALAPTVDPHLKAKLLARQFQLETVSPFVSQYVSALEGELNANFAFEMGQDAPKIEGNAQISDGVVHIPQIGQRFSDVNAKVVVDPDGRVRLDSLSARGTSGRVTANAQASLRGTNVESAKAHAQITKSEKLPVTLEGVALGDAWGKIDVNYRHTEEANEIRVDVPEFTIQLPEGGFGNVQGLDPDEHIRVGVYRGDKTFAAIPMQPLNSAKSEEPPREPPTPTKLRIHLGDSVWVQRATQAKVQLAGDLNIATGEQTEITGKIDLRGGTLDVNGKTFNIETGTVSFGGDDPSNPTIVATARWDAPEGTAVYAEYSGTVKAGKLTLRSEPPLTQPEIVSLLLFGSPEGSLGQSNGGGGGAAATAVGVAGDTAVRGFNRVMSDFTHLDVSARIDTSTGSARPEIVVQVTPRLTTRVARALGDPPPGESPDRTFLTLELRLQRSWAISAVVGDRGASILDLIWRKRY